QAAERLVDTVGGARPVPWEFEGLHTILSLVARGIGITVVPALALAAGDQDAAVRRIPECTLAREVYAVTRAASVRRPSVAVTLRASYAAARGGQPAPPAPRPGRTPTRGREPARDGSRSAVPSRARKRRRDGASGVPREPGRRGRRFPVAVPGKRSRTKPDAEPN